MPTHIRVIREPVPASRWRRSVLRAGVAMQRAGRAVEAASWRWSGLRAAVFLAALVAIVAAAVFVVVR